MRASPIGEVGLYYTVLGSIVLLMYAAARKFMDGTDILLPLGVLFWATGAVVSVVGSFRLAGRRKAIGGVVLSLLGVMVYLEFFA